MPQQLTLTNLRVIPRESNFLDRKLGSRGEIFFDRENNTLRIYDGTTTGGSSLAKDDLSNVSNADFLAKATAASVGSAGINGFSTIAVAGQSNIIADSSTDTLTFSAGNNITLTTDASTDTLTISAQTYSLPVASTETLGGVRVDGNSIIINNGVISATGSGGEAVANFSFFVAGNDSTLREISNGESIKFIGADGIAVTTNVDGDITITGTGSAGNIIFAGNVIDSVDSTSITITPAVNFESDVVIGNEIVFSDGSRQSTSAVGIPGPQGPQGPPGATGAGTGDVVSAGGGYVDNRIVRYDGTSGTIIQVSSASISDVGLLTATSFSGDGSLITALNAAELTSGTVPDARFPATLPSVSGANLTNLNAANLGSGTVPDARFPATLPSVSGANLTNLNAANLGSGTVPISRLGESGTPSASTYLRGDNTWATVAGGSSSNSFETIAVAGQSSVVADSGTDTLTLVAGTGISITTNASTDSVTITSTVAAGATAFTGLSDVTSASLTVDEIYLPAITSLTVTNSGASAYLFDQYSGNNPTIYAISGTTIAFKLSASGHPFLIQDGTGTNYNTGLVHVTTGGTVTTDSAAQGKDSGTLYWKIPLSATGNYRYQCSLHGAMVGTITVKNFVSI